MFIDKTSLDEFPFTGVFYNIVVDENVEPILQKTEEVVICTVKCDIQEGGNYRASSTLKAVYEVFVPFDERNREGLSDIPVKRGDLFRGETYGLVVSGTVMGVFASQVGAFDSTGKRRGFIARVEATDV